MSTLSPFLPMPEENNLSLVRIDLTRPITVLFEKIAAAVGAWAFPGHIRRVGKAAAEVEADKIISQAGAHRTAAIIAAQGDIAVTDMQRRAAQRWLGEEVRRQENMEAVTEKALPLLSDGARPEKIEDDWIVNFFAKCRNVSSAQMQE
jgi:Protein of unknown function (DUF2806)